MRCYLGYFQHKLRFDQSRHMYPKIAFHTQRKLILCIFYKYFTRAYTMECGKVVSYTWIPNWTGFDCGQNLQHILLDLHCQAFLPKVTRDLETSQNVKTLSYSIIQAIPAIHEFEKKTDLFVLFVWQEDSSWNPVRAFPLRVTNHCHRCVIIWAIGTRIY